MPVVEGCEIVARLEPARETSGDFFDVIPMWDGRLGLVIADVSDKGLGAALMMALCRTLLRVYAVEYSIRQPESYANHPEQVITTVNRWIVEQTSSDLFVTLFYGIYDPQTRTLTYTNAGHNPPLLYRPGDSTVHKLVRTGLPVGLFHDHLWERAGVQIKPDVVLVLYTDGVTEAMNEARDLFGEDRLHRAISANLGRPPHKISQAVFKSVGRFVSEAPRSDDITLVIVRWDGLTMPDASG
jgi:sigma-B regulation protein RsbU (phosphoserine phosphatase)